ncbi:carboxypeptidase-like regulatory domain-containing protein [uncultured Croceitalea sp.]|uniref:carboxypeptidase-like regulatory domain-containing protein n=1 Tax=uncultured Croceitalea sp. TaxID=1798908 RepID=UPI00374E5446
MINRFLTLFFFLGICSLYSQIVYDTINTEPVALVDIFNKETNEGTISNDDGKFSVEVFNTKKKLSLQLSKLGYETKTIEVISEFLRDTIYLIPKEIVLDEVVLRNFSPKDTLIKAIKNIDKNYFYENYNPFGFYRESLKEDNSGVSLIEVSFLSQFSSKNKEDISYDVEILQGRQTKNLMSMDFEIVGGMLQILYLSDLVRQKNLFFDIKNLEEYNISYEGYIPETESEGVYSIFLRPSNQKGTLNAKIYIESENLAIVQIELWRDENKLRKMAIDEGIENFEPRETTSFFMNSYSTVRYKKINNKYFLSFSDIANTRRIFLEEENHEYEINAKLIITNNQTVNVKSVKSNYKFGSNLSSQLEMIPKLKHWDESSALYFTENEKKILREITKKSVHRH